MPINYEQYARRALQQDLEAATVNWDVIAARSITAPPGWTMELGPRVFVQPDGSKARKLPWGWRAPLTDEDHVRRHRLSMRVSGYRLRSEDNNLT